MGEPAITPVSQRPATARSGGKKDQNADDKKDIAIDTDGNTAERTTSENVESRAAAALRSFGNSASQISPFVGAGLGTALGGPLGGAAVAGAFAGLPALGQAAAKAWEALSNRGGGGSCGPEGCPPGRGTPGTPPSGSTPPSGGQSAAYANLNSLSDLTKGQGYDPKKATLILVGFKGCSGCDTTSAQMLADKELNGKYNLVKVDSSSRLGKELLDSIPSVENDGKVPQLFIATAGAKDAQYVKDRNLAIAKTMLAALPPATETPQAPKEPTAPTESKPVTSEPKAISKDLPKEVQDTLRNLRDGYYCSKEKCDFKPGGASSQLPNEATSYFVKKVDNRISISATQLDKDYQEVKFNTMSTPRPVVTPITDFVQFKDQLREYFPAIETKPKEKEPQVKSELDI